MPSEARLREQAPLHAATLPPSGGAALRLVSSPAQKSLEHRRAPPQGSASTDAASSYRGQKILARGGAVDLPSWADTYDLSVGYRSAAAHLALYTLLIAGITLLGAERSSFTEVCTRLGVYLSAAALMAVVLWRFRYRWESCGARLRMHVLATVAAVAALTVLKEVLAGPGAANWLFISCVLLAGTLALVRVPAAAAQYVALVGTGWMLLIGAAVWPAALLLLLAAAIVHRLARMQAYLFQRSADGAREGEERALAAEAVIRSFEESGNNWLWKVGTDGSLAYVSARFAEILEQDATELLGCKLTDILRDKVKSSEQHSAFRTLEFYMAAKISFQEIVLAVTVNGTERWISIAGTALMDERRQFMGYSGVGGDLTAARKAEDHARQLALFDNLTGLPNRAHFHSILDELLDRTMKQNSSCTLMFIDLDRFKIVNDTLGHPVGDELLRHVARRIDSVVKEGGQAGRLGGDEFVVVFPGVADRTISGSTAGRLIAELSAPYYIGGSQIQIGASVGLATGPGDGDRSDDLIRHADLALYAAKQEGRGTYRFYDKAMGASAEFRRSLELDLRNALANGQLRLLYQPFFDIKGNKLAGFEALLRWKHPSRGDIPPEEFVSIAEESGLITRIGEWVLRTALADAATWPQHIGIAVNLSPLQLQDGGFSALMMSALSNSQISPGRVELEITESVFLQETLTTLQNLERIKALGARLALDDFGTGYSSLGYLRKGSFSKIKIDRSFVEGIEDGSGGSASIVRAVVALAESLGMSTTAEGAETPDQIETLRQIGCSHVQGFAYGAPMIFAEACLLVSKAGSANSSIGLEPRERRLAMLRSIDIKSGEMQRTGILRNVSAGGAMLEIDQTLPLGCTVELLLHPHRATTGTVRWVADKRIGVMFDQQVEVNQLT